MLRYLRLAGAAVAGVAFSAVACADLRPTTPTLAGIQAVKVPSGARLELPPVHISEFHYDNAGRQTQQDGLTITYNGLGSSLYEGGGALLYDNKYVGAVMANWTRGVAKVRIRASGPVGKHTIDIADAISFKYLNIEQSPIPWGTGFTFTFTVTKDNGRPAPSSTGRNARR